MIRNRISEDRSHDSQHLHVAHFMGVMKCAVEAFKTCSNQGLTPTYLQKVGSIFLFPLDILMT